MSASPSDRTDIELLRGAADDPELFGELYRRHVTSLLSWFTARTGDAQAAADLTAETFAAAFVARKRFHDQGVPVIAWLFGIGRNQLGTYARRQRVEQRARKKLGMPPIELGADDIERVEAMADLDPLRAEVRRALRELPVGQSEALRLRLVDGLSFAEVGARLGITEGAARVRVFRGLAAVEAGLAS